MKRDTLKGKLFLCLLVITAGFIITGFLLFGMMNYIQGRMEKLVNINSRVYNLKSMVNEIIGSYKDYTVYFGEDDKETMYGEIEDLLKESKKLKHYIFEDAYVREIEDLSHMTETLTEQIQQAVSEAGNMTRRELLRSYDELNYTARLIDRYYDYVYSGMEEYSDRELKRLEREKTVIEIIFVLVIVLMLAGTAAMLRWFSLRVLHPVSELAFKAAAFRAEKPEKGHGGKDEIQNLTETFDAMTKRIEQQVEQLEINMKLELELKQQRLEKIRQDKLLQESEMKALQARINPHFMFNTLNSIAQMAYIEEAGQTERMIEAVSDYFRYNLKDIHHISTMEDEVKNVKDYVYIQKMRFGSRIDFILEYDKETGKGKIPALILQPVVENSIVHGIGSYKENARIEIRIEAAGYKRDQLRIEITDNGIGIERDKLLAISDYINGREERGMHSESIGLKNVIDRMRSFFGDDFLMKVTSEPCLKTTVEMIIPYEENLCIRY